MSPLVAQAIEHLRAGRPAAAVPYLRAAAKAQPSDPGLLHDLGLACLDSGQIPEAITALQAAIAAKPDFAEAHLRLGIALEAAGDVDAARAAYGRACSIRPDLADGWYRSGELLDSLGLIAEATEAYRLAAAEAAGTTLGRIAAAKALRAESRDAEAEQAARQALALDPDNAAAAELLGHILADLGRLEEARACLLQAVERAPQRSGSYDDIVRCRPIRADDAALVARMREAAALPGLEPAQRSRVHLAVGRAEDDLGDPEAAMRHFAAAEALRNPLVRFDLGAYEARADRMIARLKPGSLAGVSSSAGAPPAPILVLGLPRSGTTLVEQILSSHPDVAAGGELGFWNERGRQWEQAGSDDAAAWLAKAGADYLRQLGAMAPGARHVTDKMPLNLHWAGLVARAVPNAVILYCRRRPIDTALSIHRTHFNPRLAFPTGGAALVGYMRATQRLAAHWQAILPHGRFHRIDYETLVADPEPAIRGLVAACGLAWHPACLQPERNERVIRTPSRWQARQPIYRTAPDRWRRYAPWLGPLAELLDDDARPI